jgi:hypothetical protein
MHEAKSMLKLPTDLFWPLLGGAEAPVFTEFWSLLALARTPPELLDELSAQPAATSRSPASRAAAAPTRRDWPRLREFWVIGAVCMSASPSMSSRIRRSIPGGWLPRLRIPFLR